MATGKDLEMYQERFCVECVLEVKRTAGTVHYGNVSSFTQVSFNGAIISSYNLLQLLDCFFFVFNYLDPFE